MKTWQKVVIGVTIPIIIIVVIVVGLFIYWGLTASSIVTNNIQRKVIQHSWSYTQTKIQYLEKLQGDWLQLDTEIKLMKSNDGDTGIIQAKEAQQANDVREIKYQSSLIPADAVPPEIETFINEH